MKSESFEHGLTVKQLKDIIKDWAEEDDTGDPCLVFIETSTGNASRVRTVWTLNQRENEERKQWADIYFDPEFNEFEDLECNHYSDYN